MKHRLNKTLTWVIVGLFLLAVLTGTAVSKGITLNTESVSLLTGFMLAPLLLVPLLFLALIIKAIVSTKTRWTRWSCVAGGALLLIGSIILGITITLDEWVEYLVFILWTLMILPLLILPLVIRKSYWTKWLFASEMFVLFILSCIILVVNVNKMPDEQRLQSRVVYRNANDSNEYVAVFGNLDNGGTSKKYFVERKFGFIRKKHFKKSMLSGVWVKYDEEGKKIAEYTFDKGEVLYKNFPQHANRIEDAAAFYEMATSSTGDSVFVVLNEVIIEHPVVIRDKEILDIEGFGQNNTRATLTSTYQNPVNIIFEGCEHVSLKNLNFSFPSAMEQPFIISFKNCGRIEIIDCSFWGDAAYALHFDEGCESVFMEDNRIDGFRQYGVLFQEKEHQYIANDNYYYYKKDRWIRSHRIWIENFEPVGFDSFQLDETYVNEESWYFKNYQNYGNDEYNIGAYMGDCLYLPKALGLERYLREHYFSSLKGDDLSTVTNMLGMLSGINPVLHPRDQLSDLKFKHINPAFVQWAEKRINADVVNPDFYHYVLQPFSRLFCESYLYLQQKVNTDDVIQDYYREAKSGYVSNYLGERFNGVLRSFNPNYEEGDTEEETYYGMTTQASMMGFWIRRFIDGSHKSIWKAALKFMKLYDEEWIEEKIIEYQWKADGVLHQRALQADSVAADGLIF